MRSRVLALAGVLLSLLFTSPAGAQLVPDGGFATIDGVATNLPGDLIVGTNAGPTTLVITNAGAVSSQGGTIGLSAGSNSNAVFVAGLGSAWLNVSSLRVGDQGSFNRLQISGGAVVQSGTTLIGVNSVSVSNVVEISGAGSVWTNSGFAIFGFAGSHSTIRVTNGASFNTASLSLGYGFGSAGRNLLEVQGNGASIESVGRIEVGAGGGNNTMRVGVGGTVHAPGVVIGDSDFSLSNRLEILGGTVVITNSSGNALFDVRRGTNTLNAGSLLADHVSVDATKGFLRINGGSLTTGKLTHAPGAPLHIGNGFTPATLEFTGNGSHTAPGGIQVKSGSTLKGAGNLSGNVSVESGGTLVPGNSIGKLSVAGAVTLASGSVSSFEVNKSAATNDVVSATGSLTLGGALTVTNLGGALAEGDQFKLFSAATIAGAFSSLVAEPPGPGLKWSISRIPVDGVLRVVSAANTATINEFEIVNGNNCIVCAVGGVPYDPVVLLTSTNMLTPIANWQRAATNHYDASGVVHFTNIVVTPDQQRYYRLSVE